MVLPKAKGKPYQFVTAFPADQSYLEEIKRPSFLEKTKVGAKNRGIYSQVQSGQEGSEDDPDGNNHARR